MLHQGKCPGPRERRFLLCQQYGHGNCAPRNHGRAAVIWRISALTGNRSALPLLAKYDPNLAFISA